MREQEAPRSRARRVYISAAGPRSDLNFICRSVYVDRKGCESDDLTYDQCRCRKDLLSGNARLSALVTYCWSLSTTYLRRLVVEIQTVLVSISISKRVNTKNRIN